MDAVEGKVLSLFVCWDRNRNGGWTAKPFTGNESWDNLSDVGEYNERVVLVAAASADNAAKLARSRPELAFPQILVEP